MKTTKIPTVIVSVCAVALFAACSKKEETTPRAATASETQKSTATMVDEVKKQADTVAANANATAADAVKQVEAAKDSAVDKVNAVIEKAKTLIAETKYEDASKLLQQLAAQQLTPEQQKLVDDLKAQIQKALSSKATSDAAGAVGNLLKK
jgi:thioredoxin-like negative regulator of GroEL